MHWLKLGSTHSDTLFITKVLFFYYSMSYRGILCGMFIIFCVIVENITNVNLDPWSYSRVTLLLP